MLKRPRLRTAACCLAFLLGTFGGAVAAAEDVKIGGTGNALGAMRLLAAAFDDRNSDVKSTVLPSLGSGGAIKAAIKGALDIAVSARPLDDAERSLATSLEYARTPLVFAVSDKSRATEITLDQIAQMFAGTLTKWPDGAYVRVIMRQPGDDNTVQVKGISAKLHDAVVEGEKRPGMPIAVTDQEAADKIAGIPGAMGVSTLALITSETRPLRALKVDGVEPTPQNAAEGRYPYFKRLYLITPLKPTAAAQRFVAFVRSPAGRKILAASGHWVP